jgi:preprotein translocase subunit SecG
MDLLIVLLYILFVLAAIVLIVVVLLQEGKGGGFGQALGSSGSETFGVGAKGINTFTGITAAVFLGSALLIHVLNRLQSGQSVLNTPGGESVLDQSAPPAGVPTGVPGGAPNEPPGGTGK